MKNVWIVDDDEEMIYAVRLMLKLLDCDVQHFFSHVHGSPGTT